MGTRILDTDGRTYQVRVREGVTYCTCPQWIADAMRNRAHLDRARCAHVDAYRGKQTPRSTTPAPSTPPAPVQTPRSTTPAPADDRSVANLYRASTGSQWLQFAAKPDYQIRRALGKNGAGWRWHEAREMWYHGPHGRIPSCIRTVDRGALETALQTPRSTTPVPAPSTPPAPVQTPRSTTPAPVAVKAIRIVFTEALDLNCWKLIAFPTFGAANLALRDLASRAPERGYAKTDVEIEWADGEKLVHRIDLLRAHADHAGDLLGGELRARLTFTSGRLPVDGPGQLTRAQYDALARPEHRTHAARMLDGYALAD